MYDIVDAFIMTLHVTRSRLLQGQFKSPLLSLHSLCKIKRPSMKSNKVLRQCVFFSAVTSFTFDKRLVLVFACCQCAGRLIQKVSYNEKMEPVPLSSLYTTSTVLYIAVMTAVSFLSQNRSGLLSYFFKPKGSQQQQQYKPKSRE